MQNHWLRRWSSLALLVGFFAGALGLPLADAAIYHQGPEAQLVFRVHVESKGNPACHAEHCILGLVATQPRVVGAPASSAQSYAVFSYRPPSEPAPLPPLVASVRTNLSRAPPTV